MKLAWIALVLVAACGGKIDDGDGGTGGGGNDSGTKLPDVIVTPPSDAGKPPTCVLGMGSGTSGSNGECSASQAWSCGSAQFSVTCNCPDAYCTCQSGAVGSKILTPIACPSCDVESNIDKIAELCGFPAP